MILEAVIFLENCGAEVDGLVSDGAATNRAALASFGFSGSMGSVCNRMTNPCDTNRSIYFFCDTPHLLKTARNNLLKSKEFMVRNSAFVIYYTYYYRFTLHSCIKAKITLL